MKLLDGIRDYLERHGRDPFRLGQGRISGYISAVLGLSSLLAVVCFHFPEWLTVAEFRELYGERFARTALLGALVLSFALGTLNFIANKRKRLGATGIGASAVAVVLGGTTIPVDTIEKTAFSLGLDWFVLALLASALIFIPLEKSYSKNREQNILRPQWRTDLTYFFVSHVLVQLVLIFSATTAALLVGWAVSETFQTWIQSIPWPLQLALAIVVADLAQYAVHRTYHNVEWLWRFHAVHHSSTSMDWLAGSRIHLVETMVTRSVVLVPLVFLGFSAQALNGYVIFVGVQAVLSHANTRLDGGWLRYVFVLPRYHHWHHAADPAYADKNFAVHLPVIDMIFGTFKLPPEKWPDEYGVFGEPLPESFLGQQLYPFRRKHSDVDDDIGTTATPG